MSSAPLISVIVPVYNAEKYLRHCVDSILAQSHTNLELILVDDGATDGSPQICDEYAARDSRVTVIHQENGGIAKAQNTGLDAASGDYIAFADNDDILDRRNLEYLLHALETTGADMSKARWRQFGVSQIADVVQEAAWGADKPSKVTVFAHPLTAYQTVFCKSLRLIGDRLGRNTEARYFNEANWCRLYRRELWEGLRFDLGHYAQDIRMAGPLYSRMAKVADVNETLYYWLQEPDSVTHSKRSPRFWHDNVTAAAKNFEFTLNQGVLPCRNYFGLTASTRDEGKGLKQMLHAVDAPQNAPTKHDWEQYREDRRTVRQLLSRLTFTQRLRCWSFATIRRLENLAYDRMIHNMR